MTNDLINALIDDLTQLQTRRGKRYILAIAAELQNVDKSIGLKELFDEATDYVDAMWVMYGKGESIEVTYRKLVDYLNENSVFLKMSTYRRFHNRADQLIQKKFELHPQELYAAFKRLRSEIKSSTSQGRSSEWRCMNGDVLKFVTQSLSKSLDDFLIASGMNVSPSAALRHVELIHKLKGSEIQAGVNSKVDTLTFVSDFCSNIKNICDEVKQSIQDKGL